METAYKVGAVFPREDRYYTDPETGVCVRQLTGSRGNSNHLYFTNNSFYDSGRRFVFCSDRSGIMNFYSMELHSGCITQLTDLTEDQEANHMLEAIVDAVKGRCYFFSGKILYAIDLNTLFLQVLYEMPDGFEPHIISCAQNGNYIYTSIFQDVRDQLHDIPADSRPFVEKFKRIRDSRILQINVDGSGCRELHADTCWIAHVNVSPRDETKLTFCHEGPWNLVDNRMFAMDVTTGHIKPLRPRDEREVIGHEYWYADGVRLGYHGSIKGTGQRLMGILSFDDKENRTTAFPYNTGHIFSFDEKLIVGDGNAPGKYLRLWRLEENSYTSPKALCSHFSSFKTQNDHPHPRFTDDRKAVLFSSDRDGLTNIYLAQVPQWDQLPPLAQLSDL